MIHLDEDVVGRRWRCVCADPTVPNPAGLVHDQDLRRHANPKIRPGPVPIGGNDDRERLRRTGGRRIGTHPDPNQRPPTPSHSGRQLAEPAGVTRAAITRRIPQREDEWAPDQRAGNEWRTGASWIAEVGQSLAQRLGHQQLLTFVFDPGTLVRA
jgi:hypothetical protein